MPYQCQNTDCKHVFIHPSKIQTHANPMFNLATNIKLTITENSVCPKCNCIGYMEYKEPEVKDYVLSHIQVPHAEADSYIKYGYQPVNTLAKDVTLEKTVNTTILQTANNAIIEILQFAQSEENTDNFVLGDKLLEILQKYDYTSAKFCRTSCPSITVTPDQVTPTSEVNLDGGE